MSTAPPASAARPVNPQAILLVASGATFIAFLDTTVVNVAFDKILTSFPTESLANVTWLVTAYGVLFAALLTLAGRLADVTGRRRLFLLSVAVFTLASALAMAAPDFAVLVVARAVQGVAAAGMIPSALGLILFNTPPNRRAAAIGIWGAAGSLAAAVAPALSAVLIDLTNWRVIFAINLPLGLLVLVGALRAVHPDAPTGRPLPDRWGTLAFTVGIGTVVLGLSEGENWHWGSGTVLGLLIGGAVLTAFAIVSSARYAAEGSGHSPALELDLYRNRRFALSGIGSALFGAGLYTWLLVSPLFLAEYWHYSILDVGLAITPGAFTSAFVAIAVGRRVKLKGQGIAVVLGAAVFAVVCAVMAAVLGHQPRFLEVWLWVSLFGGLGIGAALTGLTTISSTSVPPVRFSVGTGLTITARQLGGSLGVAVMAVLLSTSGSDPLKHTLLVYWFCAAASLAAAVVGVALHFAPLPAAVAAAHQPATTASKAESAAQPSAP